MASYATVTAYQHETLDALVWRAIGRGSGAVEAVMDANPGLAAIGAALPEGWPVTIPIAAAAPTTQTLVQLWD